MYREKRICVVVPAYNEENLITKTLETIPELVDRIVVVDDGSIDSTAELVKAMAEKDARIELIRHKTNSGVGRAISTGYVWCRENDIEIAVVMAGDAQMSPADLPNLLDPIVEDRADYSKGNRLVSGQAWSQIPHHRYLGNMALTFMTKIASGYWHVTDSQSGYTALGKRALHLLPLEEIYPGYGMPNDFLVTLNIFNMRVSDVEVTPIYRIGERSGIRVRKVVFSLSLLMLRLFVRRMTQKYIIRDFHPLILFYALGLGLLLVDVPLVLRALLIWAEKGSIPPINALTIVLCSIMSFQSILFAMLFDMEANRALKGRER